MKLLELNTYGSKKTAKVMEQHFGSRIAISKLNPVKAAAMLSTVRNVLKEYKKTKGTVLTENSPAYLKAVMMEQALLQHLKENATALDPKTLATMKAISSAEQGKPVATDQLKALGQIASMSISGNQSDTNAIHEDGELDESAVAELCELARPHLAKCKTKGDLARCIDECAQRDGGKNHLRIYPQAERRKALERVLSGLRESRQHRRSMIAEGSEVESAQVVLAAQDMVQSIQDMIEDVSEMQYKELPALVQAIKYDLDSAKAESFQQTAQGALSALLDNLQQQKVAMDNALGSLTGESAGSALAGSEADTGELPDLGGAEGELPDLGAEGGELPDLGAEGGELPDLGGEEEPAAPVGTKAALGRGRR